jgi:hypothetical protein
MKAFASFVGTVEQFKEQFISAFDRREESEDAEIVLLLESASSDLSYVPAYLAEQLA